MDLNKRTWALYQIVRTWLSGPWDLCSKLSFWPENFWKRFALVQLYHQGWISMETYLFEISIRPKIRRQSAALVTDLENSADFWDETFGYLGWKEFGGLIQARANESYWIWSDHHPSFSILDGGGRIKPGLNFAETDELGIQCGEDPVHVHIQATVFTKWLDHENWSIKQPRPDRNSDWQFSGHVIQDLDWHRKSPVYQHLPNYEE